MTMINHIPLLVLGLHYKENLTPRVFFFKGEIFTMSAKSSKKAENKTTSQVVPAPLTAILVDGGFYKKRAKHLFGKKNPHERANELMHYCHMHLKKSQATLYRIYYYDCPPSEAEIFHPLTGKTVKLRETEEYKWMTEFHKELIKCRKLALRRGEELKTQEGFTLRHKAIKDLFSGKLAFDDITEEHFQLKLTQKGVDIRLGTDITALANKGKIDQIIMITGDSDFVPAAKYARRAGIDFILDPMWARIAPSLHEHIDGLHTPWKKIKGKV